MKSSAREAEEDRRYAAVAIAVAASVLRPCESHGLVVFSVDDADIRDAYRLGEKMLKAGQLKKFFKSRRQLMDSIRSVVAEHGIKYCPLCQPDKPH